MSECHFWWRAGHVEWCDMTGEACDCGGWEEQCDMKLHDERTPEARLVAQAQTAISEESD